MHTDWCRGRAELFVKDVTARPSKHSITGGTPDDEARHALGDIWVGGRGQGNASNTVGARMDQRE